MDSNAYPRLAGAAHVRSARRRTDARPDRPAARADSAPDLFGPDERLQGTWVLVGRFLADAYQGRERLLQLALLNHEIEMLEPLLHNLTATSSWVQSSHPAVKVAILRTTGIGILAMPIWLGAGAQFVAPQAAIKG